MIQKRGRRMALSPAEVDAFLGAARTCRVATVTDDGSPHVSALWFVWDGAALWLNSLVRSRRWSALRRDPRVSVLIDDGEHFGELRGVELTGRIEQVGEAPRTGAPDPALAGPELLFARKYSGDDTFAADGRHAWLRLRPDNVVSWDFRKMAAPPDA